MKPQLLNCRCLLSIGVEGVPPVSVLVGKVLPHVAQCAVEVRVCHVLLARHVGGARGSVHLVSDLNKLVEKLNLLLQLLEQREGILKTTTHIHMTNTCTYTCTYT